MKSKQGVAVPNINISAPMAKDVNECYILLEHLKLFAF